jgi:uncharacterized protein (TIGR02145 family)
MANEVFDETALFWNLYFDYKHVLRDYTFKRTGLSVRCLKNNDGSPLADFTSDVTEVKLGGEVYFNDLSYNSPDKWIWNFNSPGETSTEQNPSHYFTRKGLQRITLIASNAYGFDVETKEGYVNVTQRTSVVNDIEGNIYRTVEIGNQWWMVENLKTTRFNDGTEIPLVISDIDWLESSTPAFRWYENDRATYGETYGGLYNWHTVNSGNLCPSGWHVPSDDDWKELERALGMLPEELDSTGFRGSFIGSKLADNAGLWKYYDNDTVFIESNIHFGTSGFTALAGGSLRSCPQGLCPSIIGMDAYWWSSTEFNRNEAYYRRLSGTTHTVVRFRDDKRNGYSVRCVKD